MTRRRTTAVLAALALALGVLSVATPTSASGPAFYDTPSVLPRGPHGTLVRQRPLPALNLLRLQATGYEVMYTSTGANRRYRDLVPGPASVATGTVLVPRTRWRGPGPRPVVTFAPGTQGQGHRCAASMQLDANIEYEVGSPQALLAAGYAVTITDYAGYTSGRQHPYVAGQALGHDVLDIVRAARQIPGTGITTRSPVAIWGYSEGGAAASWAGELARSYTPELRLRGVAAGGVPARLADEVGFIDGGPYVDLFLIAVRGLGTAYPAAGFLDVLNPAGLAAVRSNDEQCMVTMITHHPFRRIRSWLRPGLTPSRVVALPRIKRALDASTLGRHRIHAPVYLYWGGSDTMVNPLGGKRQFRAYCGLGTQVRRVRYPLLDHVPTMKVAIPGVVRWLHRVFAGDPPRSSCP
ncbi:MAG: hypothetical protein J7518_07580 [Nocardioidaceae bacterium]|nr:hypothetical protein [Nocardioidaceae bacterium]